MNKIPVVRADVWCDNPVGTPSQHQQLLNDIIQMYHNRTPENTITGSNKGCWRTEIDLSNYKWLYDIIDEKSRVLMEYYKEEGYFGKPETFPTMVYLRAWVNVNDPMSRNVMHSHSGSIISGVYYLQSTDTGDIIFQPNHTLNDGGAAHNSNSPYCNNVNFEPIDNSIILFPSWLPHEVEPNQSAKQRINIAFNVNTYRT